VTLHERVEVVAGRHRGMERSARIAVRPDHTR
jgi:hypothetical protein